MRSRCKSREHCQSISRRSSSFFHKNVSQAIKSLKEKAQLKVLKDEESNADTLSPYRHKLYLQYKNTDHKYDDCGSKKITYFLLKGIIFY